MTINILQRLNSHVFLPAVYTVPLHLPGQQGSLCFPALTVGSGLAAGKYNPPSLCSTPLLHNFAPETPKTSMKIAK